MRTSTHFIVVLLKCNKVYSNLNYALAKIAELQNAFSQNLKKTLTPSYEVHCAKYGNLLMGRLWVNNQLVSTALRIKFWKIHRITMFSK